MNDRTNEWRPLAAWQAWTLGSVGACPIALPSVAGQNLLTAQHLEFAAVDTQMRRSGYMQLTVTP